MKASIISPRGFSLIELVVVIAIVAILAAIAIPAYNGHVVKTKRAIAKSMLTQIANRQEMYLLDNKAYADELTDLGYSADPLYVDENSNPTTAADAVYELDITAHTTRSFTVSAKPQGAQASNDTDCGTLSLTNTGVKGESGSADVAACW